MKNKSLAYEFFYALFLPFYFLYSTLKIIFGLLYIVLRYTVLTPWFTVMWILNRIVVAVEKVKRL